MGCALSVESRHTPRASRSVNNYEGIIAVAASPFHASADRTAAHLETFVDKNKKGMSSTNTTDTINTTANMKTGTKQMAVAKEKVAAVKQMQQEQQAGSGMGRYHRCNKLRVDTSLCDAGRTPCNTEASLISQDTGASERLGQKELAAMSSCMETQISETVAESASCSCCYFEANWRPEDKRNHLGGSGHKSISINTSRRKSTKKTHGRVDSKQPGNANAAKVNYQLISPSRTTCSSYLLDSGREVNGTLEDGFCEDLLKCLDSNSATNARKGRTKKTRDGGDSGDGEGSGDRRRTRKSPIDTDCFAELCAHVSFNSARDRRMFERTSSINTSPGGEFLDLPKISIFQRDFVGESQSQQVAKQMNRLRRKAENKKFLSSDSLYSKSEATLDRCESHSDTNHAEGVTTNASTGVKTSAASVVGTEAVYFRSSVSKGAHGHDSFHLESHNTGPYGKLDAPATTLDAETLFSMHEIGSGSSHPSSHDSDRPPMGRSRNPAHHLQFVYSHESDSGAGIGDDTVDHTCQTDQETVTNIPKNARTFAYPGGEALL